MEEFGIVVPTPKCEFMESIATSPYLQALLIISLMTSVIAIAFALISLLFVEDNTKCPSSVKIQIYVHFLGVLVHCMGRLSLNIIDLQKSAEEWKNSCEILPNQYSRSILRFLFNFGLALCSMSSIAVALDRLIHLNLMLKYKQYEYQIGMSLALLQVSLAFLYLGSIYSYAPEQFELPQFQILFSSTGSFAANAIPLYCVFAFQLIAICVIAFLRNCVKYYLDHIFESNEIRAEMFASRRLLASVGTIAYVSFGYFGFLSVAVTVLHNFPKYFENPAHTAIIEIICMVPLYSIVIGVYACFRVKQVKNGEDTRFDNLVDQTNRGYGIGQRTVGNQDRSESNE